MNFDAITIRDIARELHLSVSTVSKALRDSYEISEKTKKLVTEFAQKHNYRPNPMAQSLKKGHSKSIGIVVSSIDNQFFSQVINGMESEAYSQGYNVIITQSHESYELEVQNVGHLIHRAIDGLLISIATETADVEHLRRLQQQGLPIVFFDRVSNEIDTHKVIVDNLGGAYQATMHLLASGYKNIAHITSSVTSSVTNQRLAGYVDALVESGIEVNEQYIKYCLHGGLNLDELEQAIDELMQTEPRPDAILTASDRITTSTMTLLHKKNIRIPQDVALVGFSNTVLADVLNPSLTSVHQPAFEIGRKATEMLLSIINSKRPITEFENVVLPTELFIRSSSASKLK
ncbi:LacI family DNA-binding transcriptional regulator [Mucilaginibacter lappiensis]|uniref:LacI family transcriptional regulator n=1 Tax=Mucilaginibacter lappiensis TaxID=354630 RepID=A0A1N6PZK5_9SPHI|nr:LacI family DNA-binding transcriptional regulator [Mucilaginibacter lappiensis]MBB6107403.1 LacI family transcriptional regulator [Mucilaginibacter lappiensis]MBB6126277.1 LacI family transcriptional regulator [Mucilaginibacter lappiensis]SIQ09771.1 transcriptional regulator, LacI family [Mucilaginibacter lappiensis]